MTEAEILRGRQERRRAVTQQGAELEERRGVIAVLKLDQVALLELLPALRGVVEPVTQLGRRRDVADPVVEGGGLLRQTARPEPVDQHAKAVVRGGVVVDPFDPDLHQLVPPARGCRSASSAALIAAPMRTEIEST